MENFQVRTFSSSARTLSDKKQAGLLTLASTPKAPSQESSPPVASAPSLTITVTGSFRTLTGFPFHRIHLRTYFLRLDCRPYEHVVLYSHFLNFLSTKLTFFFVISYPYHSAIPLRFHLIFPLFPLLFFLPKNLRIKNIPISLQEYGDIPF